jgi:tetratricopeptide (TPR) repeat protein
LLFRRGVLPHAIYLFKHALIQDAAYGTLLREPRRALHARIVETLESDFADIAENQPEVLARHCTEAGLIEKAVGLWGKAGQRSLTLSALVEGVEQLTRALAQIAMLPATPVLRREQIKLQVALITPLMHVKGYSAPETRAAAEQARLLIEQAEALGEPIEDPLLLFSVLYGFFIAKFISFDGDAACALSRQFLALAEQQKATAPIMIGHRLLGNTLLCLGDITEGLSQLDRASGLYDPVQHRSLATRFGQDAGVAILSYRSIGLWMLGYPQAALADIEQALGDAREIGHAPTLIFALFHASCIHLLCGNLEPAGALLDELVPLADKQGASFWKIAELQLRGELLARTDKASDAV